MSEYILYGVYVEHILGDQICGHFYDADPLCHCCWFDRDADSLSCRTGIAETAQAVLVQSNIGMDLKDIDLLMRRVRSQITT